MQILADRVNADKKALVAQNMELTETEAKSFWPIYDAYQQDLLKINIRMTPTNTGVCQRPYSKGTVDNVTAKKLLGEALAIQEFRLKLQQTYVPKLEKVLPEVKVARYIQIESKIRALVRYAVASNDSSGGVTPSRTPEPIKNWSLTSLKGNFGGSQTWHRDLDGGWSSRHSGRGPLLKIPSSAGRLGLDGRSSLDVGCYKFDGSDPTKAVPGRFESGIPRGDELAESWGNSVCGGAPCPRLVRWICASV